MSSPAATSSILGIFGLAFLVMIYGVIPWEDIGIDFTTLWWWFPEMTASFLLFAIIIGLVGGMREGELTTTFVDGARDLLGVALIIGIARGITVIMNNGQITDTVLHWAEEAARRRRRGRVRGRHVPAVPAAVVPDPVDLGSGHRRHADHGAARGLRRRANRRLVVTAYQSASGVMNLVTPTSAVVMGGLAIARVPYGTYLRLVWPLLAMLGVLTVVVLHGRGGLDMNRVLTRRALPMTTTAAVLVPTGGGGAVLREVVGAADHRHRVDLRRVLVLDADFDSARTIGYLVAATHRVGVMEFVMIGVAEGGNGFTPAWRPVRHRRHRRDHRAVPDVLGARGVRRVLPGPQGDFDFVIALATRHEVDLWWMMLIAGILEVRLGFWASGYPGRSASLLSSGSASGR